MKLIFTLTFIYLTGCQTLSMGPPAEFASDDEFRSWFAFYHRNPDPDRLPMAVRYMEKKGYLEKHPDIASVFISKVMESNPEKFPAWFESLNNAKAPVWNVLLISTWLSRVPNYQSIVNANIEKAEPDHRERLKSLDGKEPSQYDIKTIPIFDPRQINMLWAAYSVTGDAIYVNRIIDSVELYSPEGEKIESQIGETAIMTLATNTMQYEEVRQMCESAEQRHPSPRTRVLLEAMLGAVQNIVAESKKPNSTDESPTPAH